MLADGLLYTRATLPHTPCKGKSIIEGAADSK
jgi:hypothetical protein